MKHQQVVPDYVAMVKTSGTCLCLVFSGWVLFKLVQAIFWLPGYLQQNQGKLYEQVERRSASRDVRPSSGEKRKLASQKPEADEQERKDDPDIEQEAERGVGSEEKGENDAIECEADSKKDK